MKKINYFIVFFALLFTLIGCKGFEDKFIETNHSNNIENFDIGNKNSNILVAYCSLTGNTETIAKQLQSVLDCDLVEIAPSKPYKDEDVVYNDPNARASKESSDPEARPEIIKKLDNLDNYDYILLGYPIWWDKAPKVVYKFLDEYDFNGKTIIPFCTSGSSQIERSVSELQYMINTNPTWENGMRFDSKIDNLENIENWVKQLNLNTK